MPSVESDIEDAALEWLSRLGYELKEAKNSDWIVRL